MENEVTTGVKGEWISYDPDAKTPKCRLNGKLKLRKLLKCV